jgi:dihydrofolate reductase
MIIGGGDIYAQAIGLADRLIITHVDLEPAGDVVFPPIDAEIWHVVDEPDVPRSEKDEATYTIKIYERLRPAAH